jgi:membrane-associated HD superfamily phosphohydrolase
MGVLCSVMVLIALLSWLTMQIRTPLPIEYFIFLPGLSMLVAIVFDSRTAFYTTVTMTLMLAGVRGNDYDTGITMMIAGILAGYSVRDIQSRTQLFRSMFFIFIGFSITILAFSLERSYELGPTLTKLFVAGLNSAISPLITFGLLFLIEKTTNITTDL